METLKQKSPIERLADYVRSRYETNQVFENLISNLLQKERSNMLEFHQWMTENDTAENAEKYFGYSDQDMLNEYYTQRYENTTP